LSSGPDASLILATLLIPLVEACWSILSPIGSSWRMAEVPFEEGLSKRVVIVRSNDKSWVPLTCSIARIFVKTIAAHDSTNISGHFFDSAEASSILEELGTIGPSACTIVCRRTGGSA